MSPTKHIKRKVPPTWLSTFALGVTALGQTLFWSGTIQLAQASQHAHGTTTWLGGTVVFLAITARQNIIISSHVLKAGTVRQKLETTVAAIIMVLSLVAALITCCLYVCSQFSWGWLDTVCGIGILGFFLAYVLGLRSRGRVQSVRETAISIFAILNRSIPRVTLSIGILLTAYTSLSLETIIGGQVIAMSRTFNVYVSSLYDPYSSPWPLRTEAWGNLATHSLLAFTWLAVTGLPYM